MGYQLKHKENLGEGLKRISKEQLEKAIHNIDNADQIEHKVVHDVRKRFKKIRAVIRLIRDNLGNKLYQEENSFYRDLGRELSEIRDSVSAVNIAQKLKGKYEGKINNRETDALINELEIRKNELSLKFFNKEDSLGKVRSELEKRRDMIDQWPKIDSFADIQSNFKRVYKRGYKAIDVAYQDPTIENFHELRKRVKYLWYHFRILRTMWPKVMNAWRKELDVMGDYLGDDHDLGVLLMDIKDKDNPLYHVYSYQLEEKITDYRNQLEESAYPLGKKLYTDKPKVMVSRLNNYWKSYEHEVSQNKALAVNGNS